MSTNKYKIRVEFIVTTAEFCEVIVEAANVDEARNRAISMYTEMVDNGEDIHYWEGDSREVEIDTYAVENWDVEQC